PLPEQVDFKLHVRIDFHECVDALRKVERDVPARRISMSTIRKPIESQTLLDMTKLIEQTIHFAHIYRLMVAQAHGEPGPLLVNRWNNSFVVSADWVVVLRYYNQDLAREEGDRGEFVTMWYEKMDGL